MKNLKTNSIVFLLVLLIIFLFSNCNKTTIEPEPEKQRTQFDWFNETFTIYADSVRYFSSDLEISDTLNFEVSILFGTHIEWIFLTDEYYFQKFQNGEMPACYYTNTDVINDTYEIVIPYDLLNPTYYFVFCNYPNNDSIEVQAKCRVTRWIE